MCWACDMADRMEEDGKERDPLDVEVDALAEDITVAIAEIAMALGIDEYKSKMLSILIMFRISEMAGEKRETLKAHNLKEIVGQIELREFPK